MEISSQSTQSLPSTQSTQIPRWARLLPIDNSFFDLVFNNIERPNIQQPMQIYLHAREISRSHKNFHYNVFLEKRFNDVWSTICSVYPDLSPKHIPVLSEYDFEDGCCTCFVCSGKSKK